MNKRLNIIHIVVNDLGRFLGCYGRPVRTPHLNLFAEGGIQFDQAYCTSTTSSPSRICCMTGMYPQTSGGVGLAHMGWPLGVDVKTVVDYLNQAGYQTAHFGLSHERHPLTSRYEVDEEKEWIDFKAQVAVDKAIDFIKRRETTRPLYLNLGTQEVHHCLWLGLSIPEAAHQFETDVNPDRVKLPPWEPDLPETRLNTAKFFACIESMDRQIGRLLESLRKNGYFENSLILFTSNHGIAGTRAKGTVYDAGMEIALLMRVPWRKTPIRHNHLIGNIDLMPTLLEVAGVSPPESIQGRSFWPLICDKPYTPNNAIFLSRNFHGQFVSHRPGYNDYYDPCRSVRTAEWHYIRNFVNRPRYWKPGDSISLWKGDLVDMCNSQLPSRDGHELYNTVADPQELHNLADQPEYAEKRIELSNLLTKWLLDTDDFVLRGEVPIRPVAPGWGKSWPVRPR